MHDTSIQREMRARGNCKTFSSLSKCRPDQRRAVRTVPEEVSPRARTVFTRSAAASAVAQEDWKP